MKRYLGWLALVICVAGCHSVLLAFERRGSAGIVERVPEPGEPFFDGHAIPFPSKAFVNCVDVVMRASQPREPCNQAGVPSFVGYHREQNNGARVDDAPVWLRRSSLDRDLQALRLLVSKYDVADGRVVSAQPDVQFPVPVLSFIHISDAQIREPAATLGGQQVSDQLDPLIQSFAHDYQQELYSAFVYDAFVRTVNAEVSAVREQSEARASNYRPAPSFLIHTGDAIDAGLESEFVEFMARSDALTIPWYNVIGNHDVLGFGNLLVTPGKNLNRIACTQTGTMLREYYLARPASGWLEQRRAETTVASQIFSLAPALVKRVCLRLDVDNDRLLAAPLPGERGRGRDGVTRFVEAHCRPGGQAGCAPPPNQYAYARKSDGTPSQQNGFDLHPQRRGYYSFSVAAPAIGPERRVWIVVLNTSSPIGAYGTFAGEQRSWLQRILRGRTPADGSGAKISRDDVVLVFAHHPLWGIESPVERRDLQAILFESGNVAAYFAGHTHAPQLRVVEASAARGAPRMWEVIASSTISFPQQARQVTLRVVPGSRLAYLEILTFEPHLRHVGQSYFHEANRGAERDHCHQWPRSCRNGRPLAPNRDVIYPRLFFRLAEPAPRDQPPPAAVAPTDGTDPAAVTTEPL
jgi:hypothetical protein